MASRLPPNPKISLNRFWPDEPLSDPQQRARVYSPGIPEGDTQWWKLPPTAQSTLGWACHHQRVTSALRWAYQRPRVLHADTVRHCNEIAAENRNLAKLLHAPRQGALL